MFTFSLNVFRSTWCIDYNIIIIHIYYVKSNFRNSFRVQRRRVIIIKQIIRFELIISIFLSLLTNPYITKTRFVLSDSFCLYYCLLLSDGGRWRYCFCFYFNCFSTFVSIVVLVFLLVVASYSIYLIIL